MHVNVPDQDPQDLNVATERYRLEREKRMRADGTAQYRPLAAVAGDFDRDPYADPDFARDPIAEQIDVAIIGGGFGGMLTAADLVRRGQKSFRVIDKAGDFGGTWYWNRYPGAACDIESYIYLPLLEETGYVPTEKYAKATEIFAHCKRIANHFDLYPHALFQTEVSELRWQEESSRWLVTTSRGDRIEAKFVLVAGGILHKAKLPAIPGIETFKGRCFHTSRWDYDYTGGSPTTPMDKLADKRVVLIGTGATSVQAMPRLAETAGELLLVQRTPSGVGVRANRPTDPEWAATLKPGWQRERMENFTAIVNGLPTDSDMVGDGWTEIFRRNPQALAVVTPELQEIDFAAMEQIRARVDSIVQDPITASRLKPWYNQMCKRPCFHDEYLPAFNRPNVKLLDTDGKGVERITEDSIVIDGQEHKVDAIIYGTGFEVGSSHFSRLGFEIYGRGGESLTEAWSQGPATLHGMMTDKFPNLLMFHTAQGGFAINFVHMLCELAEHAAWIFDHCLRSDIAEIEPTPEAQDAWFQNLLGRIGGQAAFYAQCTPSYANAEGSMDPSAIRSIPFFGSTLEYFQVLREWREAGDLPGVKVAETAA